MKSIRNPVPNHHCHPVEKTTVIWAVIILLTNGEFEGAVLEGGVVGAEDDGVPDHDVVVARSPGHTGGGILLQLNN